MSGLVFLIEPAGCMPFEATYHHGTCSLLYRQDTEEPCFHDDVLATRRTHAEAHYRAPPRRKTRSNEPCCAELLD
jgi:hypothetical protein